MLHSAAQSSRQEAKNKLQKQKQKTNDLAFCHGERTREKIRDAQIKSKKVERLQFNLPKRIVLFLAFYLVGRKVYGECGRQIIKYSHKETSDHIEWAKMLPQHPAL